MSLVFSELTRNAIHEEKEHKEKLKTENNWSKIMKMLNRDIKSVLNRIKVRVSEILTRT